jgi:hypothetical protein
MQLSARFALFGAPADYTTLDGVLCRLEEPSHEKGPKTRMLSSLGHAARRAWHCWCQCLTQSVPLLCEQCWSAECAPGSAIPSFHSRRAAPYANGSSSRLQRTRTRSSGSEAVPWTWAPSSNSAPAAAAGTSRMRRKAHFFRHHSPASSIRVVYLTFQPHATILSLVRRPCSRAREDRDKRLFQTGPSGGARK